MKKERKKSFHSIILPLRLCVGFFLIISFSTILFFVLFKPPLLFNVTYSPVLYSRDYQLLGAQVAFDGQWRFPANDNLNERFVISLIEAEDRRFWQHNGVDPLAIARAAVQNIRSRKIVSGGSTITMQTIRLARRYEKGARRRTFLEKGIEAILALRLELGKSKEEILLLYTANAPFGGNVVGLQAASWRWFGRSAEDLSWAEAATLAILPNSPGLIHPGRNRDALKTRRDVLLRRLYAAGHIDSETLFLSLLEPLPNAPLPLPRLAPHLLDRLVIEKGGVSAFTNNAAFVTTIDRDIQERTKAILNRASQHFASNGIMNGAAVVINTRTGEAAAYVGNTLTGHAQNVDIVVARRSSGSLLKPFLYAAMLDSGDILPSSLISDIPTRVGSFSPENITRTYLGVVPADEALARSLNVPAARMLRSFGVDRFLFILRSLGLTTLFRPAYEYGLPLVLGGSEVTLWEITGLYAGLGRASQARGDERIFFHPTVFLEQDGIDFSWGRRAAQPLMSSPISPAAAWLTMEALVYGARPGDEAMWQEYASSRRIAWKTGTSFGLRDAWSIGVTPEWTVGVWIGNASGEGRPELRSSLTAAPVMFEIFSALDAMGGRRDTWFHQPAADLLYNTACASSGFPASIHCANVTYTLIPRNAPMAPVCSFCRTVILNETEDRRITLEPGSFAQTVKRQWFVLPPAEEWHFRRWNLDYRPLPPFKESLFGDREEVLALFNPQSGGQVIVPRELDGRDGRLVFSAAHRDETEIIFWHLDGDFLGMTQNFHEIEARPLPGNRTVTLVDSAGNTLRRSFTVLNTVE